MQGGFQDFRSNFAKIGIKAIKENMIMFLVTQLFIVAVFHPHPSIDDLFKFLVK